VLSRNGVKLRQGFRAGPADSPRLHAIETFLREQQTRSDLYSPLDSRTTANSQMAPQQAALVNLSPAELSFLRSALAQTPPIRLDVTKGPRDFRSMRAEYDVLPGANGSARIALEDGTEALVGVKAEVERTRQRPSLGAHEDVEMRDDG
jgi:hypothetical protein